MNAYLKALSEVDPSRVPPSVPATAARQTPAASVPKPAPRPAGGANGATQAPPSQKRKAEGQPDNAQTKIQRRDGITPPARPNGSARPASSADGAKGKAPTPSTSIPYRGTAGGVGLNTARPSNVVAKKPVVGAGNPSALSKSKSPAPPPKPSGTTTVSGAAPAPAKKGGYAAMLQRAKEAQQAKPPAPPIKHEPTKILTKKERLALRAEASAIAKGKKPGLTGLQTQGRAADGKGANVEKRKPVELGYQGTARPAKKPVDIGYKGTARPATAPPGLSGKAPGPVAAKPKPKPKPSQGRYGGYASWSDEELDDEEEDEEDGYESDGTDMMEGGIWDVEEEEELALKVAKKEDAAALAEENELKRQKEERKRKLMAMNKAAANKRKY